MGLKVFLSYTMTQNIGEVISLIKGIINELGMEPIAYAEFPMRDVGPNILASIKEADALVAVLTRDENDTTIPSQRSGRFRKSAQRQRSANLLPFWFRKVQMNSRARSWFRKLTCFLLLKNSNCWHFFAWEWMRQNGHFQSGDLCVPAYRASVDMNLHGQSS